MQSTHNAPTAVPQTIIEVTASDLPLYCPMPNTPQWNSHPRVVVPVAKLGEARCPYCGTLYKFKGELPQGHH
ncbi:MAG: zinc-finger domain-containing protein [Candidatus Nitrotoga sp.]